MESDSLITRMIKSSHQVRAMYNDAITRAAEQCSLTRPEADVLLFLRNNPTLNTARDVAHYRGFSKAYVSKAVDPLLRRNFISMRTDSQDRRRQLLTITGGAAEADKLHEAQLEFFAMLVRGIPKADLDKFIAVNEAMYQNVKTAFDTGAARGD